jgi:glycosyltransferase involved in cell wall biosynthesis
MASYEPQVSVVIPTIHRPQLVLRAVRSVLAQSFRAVEVVVVVDGEDPSTLETLKAIADPRMRVVALAQNVGCAEARNSGVSEARCRWIAFLDDDDEWLPNKIEVQLRVAARSRFIHPIVSCRVIARTRQGDLLWPRRLPEPDEPLSEYLFCQRGLWGGEGLVLSTTILTSRELLREVPFRLRRHNDVDWLLRATAVKGAQVEFVPEQEPLGIWNMDIDRPRISNTSQWRFSLDWIRKNRHLVTPRAYAAFVLIWASSTAARGRDWRGFWSLTWDAFRSGQPTLIQVVAHMLIWLVPSKLRGRAAVFMQRRRLTKAQDLGCGGENPTDSKDPTEVGRAMERGGNPPSVSVVIATRNRPESILRAVCSVLENDHPNFEVVVVDQSDNDKAHESLHFALKDSRLRYIRVATTGRSAALNCGISASHGQLIAMTDDDCEVSPTWVRDMAAALTSDTLTGIVFGNVIAAAHDRSGGAIPAYVRDAPFMARGVRDKHQVDGLGACMGLKRAVWLSLGGFDEMLGAGTPFGAGEDGDAAIRALLGGYSIYETPSVTVTHHGFRASERIPELIHTYWYGTGAMLGKHLRCNLQLIVPHLAELAWRWMFGESRVAASLGHGPRKWSKLVAFVRGWLAGTKFAVDRTAVLYIQPQRQDEMDSSKVAKPEQALDM